MTLNAALWASSTALTGKVAVAHWVASLLFLFCDRRRISSGWQVLLSAGSMLLSISAGMYASSATSKWAWIVSVACACVATIFHMRTWSRVSPSEIFSEVSQIDPLPKKKKSASKSFKPIPKSQSPAVVLSPAMVLAIAGAIAATVALGNAIFVAIPQVAWIAAVHAVAICMLLGVAIFCAIELTFDSAPASLAAVAWSVVAMVAIVAWIAEIFVAGSIVMSPVGDQVELPTAALTRLFALSVLVIDFVVWMIPQRVAAFKRAGKATAWVSLSLAAWIGALSLIVLCALPSSWPWKL